MDQSAHHDCFIGELNAIERPIRQIKLVLSQELNPRLDEGLNAHYGPREWCRQAVRAGAVDES